MLTQAEIIPLKYPILLRRIHLPLLHQLQPQLLRRLHTNREIIHLLEDLILHLGTEFRQRLPTPSNLSIHLRTPPISLLRGYIGSTDDPDSWID